MRNFALSKRKNAHTFETQETPFVLSSSRPKRRVKHSDGRQSTSSFCGNIVTADRILPRLDEGLSRATEYPILQDGILSRATEYLLQLRKYSDGRQSTSAFCASIVTADRIPNAAGWNTMTADKVHYTTAETLRRQTEYFRNLRKHRGGRQNIQSVYYRLLVQLKIFFSFFCFFFFICQDISPKPYLLANLLGV